MSVYDTIFLGSSPVQLMAHNLSCKGHQSLLIEKESRFGGAWYTDEVWNVDNVELGCHILKNNPKGLDLIQKCGVKLEEMEIQPTIYYCTYKGQSFMNSLKLLYLKASKTFSKNKLHSRYFVNKLEGLFKGESFCRYQYLNKGCYELINQLQPNPETIVQGQKVQTIRFENELAKVTIEDGRTFSTKKLYLPKNYKVDEFLVNDSKIEFEYDIYISEHYVFKFDNHSLNHFSFVDVIGDDLLNLVSNVGLFTDMKSGTILTTAIKKPTAKSENNLEISGFDGYPNDQEQQTTADRIMQKLHQFGIVDKNISYSAFHYEPYLLDVKKNSAAYDIDGLTNGAIISLNTTDLVDSVISNPVINASS